MCVDFLLHLLLPMQGANGTTVAITTTTSGVIRLISTLSALGYYPEIATEIDLSNCESDASTCCVSATLRWPHDLTSEDLH